MLLRPISLLARFLLGLSFARILRADEYGTYAFAAAWLALISLPASMGVEHISVKYMAIYHGSRQHGLARGLIRFVTRSVLLSTGVCMVVAIAIAAVTLGVGQRQAVFMLMMLVLPFAGLAQARQGLMRGMDRPLLGQLPDTIVTPILLVLTLYLLHYMFGTVTARDAAGANVLAWGMSTLLGGWMLAKVTPGAVLAAHADPEPKGWRLMVPALVAVGFAYNLLSRADILVLGSMRESALVAHYTVASRLAELVMFSYEAAFVVGAGMFSRIFASGDRKALQHFVTLLSRWILVTAVPVTIVFIVFAESILSVFGHEYIAAVHVFRVLCVGYFLSSIFGFVIVMAYMANLERDAAIIVGVGGVLNLLSSAILVPRFGAMGAAVSCSVATVCVKLALMIQLRRRVGVWCLPLVWSRKTRTGSGPEILND